MLFPGDLYIAQCEVFASGNTEGLGETKLAVSQGASPRVFHHTSQLKNGANREKNISCCYYWELVSFVHPKELVSFVHPKGLVSFVHPKELVSFVHPKELASFDPRHLTHCPPIKKRI